MDTENYKLTAVVDLYRILEKFLKTRSDVFESVSSAISRCVRAGNKVLVFGNGGSAAEAQHFAAELVNGMTRRDVPATAAIALTTDTSCLTAIGNDRGFISVFSRQLEALGREGDVAIALTTSGESVNILEALKAARIKGLLTVALTGDGGGKTASLADYLLDVPALATPRIQEAHLFILHMLAVRIEMDVCGQQE
jgi:D-sedoheptulose 7-phosphate isomerase